MFAASDRTYRSRSVIDVCENEPRRDRRARELPAGSDQGGAGLVRWLASRWIFVVNDVENLGLDLNMA